MDMPQQLQCFVRVAELASFTLAAEDIGVPRATVSMAIQRLEKEVGARLLQRTTRRVSLTPDGQIFYERARELLADLEETLGLFKSAPAQISGRLRIDLPLGIARHLVIPALPDFFAAYPAIQLELSSTDRQVDLIREGFDCVLRVGQLEDSSLIARPLGALRQVNCASPAYLERWGEPQQLADLAHHRLVHYQTRFGSKPSGFEYQKDRATGILNQPMSGHLSVNNSDAYAAACLAGLGIVQAPLAGLAPYLQSGQLVEIMPTITPPALPVSLLYASRRQMAQRVQIFSNWLQEVLEPYLAQ